MEIKKIKKISLANIAGLLYALFGLITSFSVSIHFLIIIIREKQIAGKLAIYILTNLGLAFLIAIAAAIIAGAIGWLLGFITAIFYNFIAREIGGVKVELAEDSISLIKAESTAIKPAAEKINKDLFKY